MSVYASGGIRGNSVRQRENASESAPKADSQAKALEDLGKNQSSEAGVSVASRNGQTVFIFNDDKPFSVGAGVGQRIREMVSSILGGKSSAAFVKSFSNNLKSDSLSFSISRSTEIMGKVNEHYAANQHLLSTLESSLGVIASGKSGTVSFTAEMVDYLKFGLGLLHQLKEANLVSPEEYKSFATVVHKIVSEFKSDDKDISLTRDEINVLLSTVNTTLTPKIFWAGNDPETLASDMQTARDKLHRLFEN